MTNKQIIHVEKRVIKVIDKAADVTGKREMTADELRALAAVISALAEIHRL